MRTDRRPSGFPWPATFVVLAGLSAVAVASTEKPAALPALAQVYAMPEPSTIDDFELIDQNGEVRRFSGFRGQPTLVLFGFASCPKICPSVLARLRALHDARGGALRPVNVVMISVDGARDTPAALKAYLEPLSPDFIGLTGEPARVTGIAAQFSAFFVKEPPGKDGNYNVGHTARIFVVDKQGRLRASFGNASIDDMAQVMAILIGEPG
jgi:protein SCO1/2